MGVEWTPVLLFGLLFLFLGIRSYFRYKLHASALEKGLALPESPKGDLRKKALVLIALGLGYSIAVHTTLSFETDADAVAPLAASIWGIVPILIGAGQWLYWRMTEKERAGLERGQASLT